MTIPFDGGHFGDSGFDTPDFGDPHKKRKKQTFEPEPHRTVDAMSVVSNPCLRSWYGGNQQPPIVRTNQ
jgi:hypothetical protein